MSASYASWRQANFKKLKDASADRKANERNRYAANPTKQKAARLAYYSANREKCIVAMALYRAENIDRLKAYDIKRAADNPEGRRIHGENRRARKREAEGKLSKGLAAKLFKLQNGKCPCCKQPLGNSFHLDHIQPLALGGSNTDGNIQLLRQQCNQQKGAKHPIAFMRDRGFLL